MVVFFLCHLEDKTKIRTDSGRTSVLSGSIQLQTHVQTHIWHIDHGMFMARVVREKKKIKNTLFWICWACTHGYTFPIGLGWMPCRCADLLTVAGPSTGPTEKPASKATEWGSACMSHRCCPLQMLMKAWDDTWACDGLLDESVDERSWARAESLRTSSDLNDELGVGVGEALELVLV